MSASQDDNWTPEQLWADGQSLRGFALRLVHGDPAADDLVQEAVLLAITRPPPSRGKPRAWLAGVIRNLARTRWRSERRRRAREERAARAEPLPSAAETSGRLDMQRHVLNLALDLPDPYRSTLLLRYFEGLTPTQIAEHLSIPLGTVKTHLQRALNKIRAKLDARHGGDRSAWHAAVLAPLSLTQAGGPPVLRGPLAVPGTVSACLLVATLLTIVYALSRTREPDAAPHRADLGLQAPKASAPTLLGRARRGVVGASAGDGSGPRNLDVTVTFVELSPSSVTVAYRPPAGRTRYVTTSPDGVATLRQVPLGPMLVWLHQGEGVTSFAKLHTIGGADPESVNVEAIVARDLFGRVLAPTSGRPIAGATIQFALPLDLSPIPSPAWVGVSDSDGHFVLRGVPAEARWGFGHVSALAPGRGTAQVRVPPAAELGTRGRPVQIRLAEGCSLSGKARDLDGSLIAGATVALYPYLDGRESVPFAPHAPFAEKEGSRCVPGWTFQGEMGDRIWDLPLYAVSDADGAFRLDGVVCGAQYCLTASRQGRRWGPAQLLRCAVSGEVRRVDVLVREPHADLVVRVMDPEGRPVEGAKVGAGRLAKEESPGSYWLRSVTLGPSVITVEAGGFAPQRFSCVVEAGQPIRHTVTLERGEPFEGKVADAAGRPIPGAVVSLSCSSYPGVLRATSNQAGAFTFACLLPGDVTLWIAHHAYKGMRHAVALPASAQAYHMQPVDVLPPIHLDVSVRGGEPPPSHVEIGFQLHGYAGPGRFPSDQHFLETIGGASWGEETRPWDPSGYLVRDHPPSGVLVVRAPGFEPVFQRFEVTPPPAIQVKLVPASSVRGMVWIDGTPMPGAWVHIEEHASGVFRSTRSSGAGEFQFRDVARGAVRVWVSKPGYVRISRSVAVGTDGADVSFGMERGTMVRGQVVSDAESVPLLWTIVDVYSIDEQGRERLVDTLSADGRGRFDVHVAQGRYRLDARRPGTRRQPSLDGTTRLVVGQEYDLAVEVRMARDDAPAKLNPRR